MTQPQQPVVFEIAKPSLDLTVTLQGSYHFVLKGDRVTVTAEELMKALKSETQVTGEGRERRHE